MCDLKVPATLAVVATVADVMTIPALRGSVGPLVPGALDRVVESIVLIEDVHAISTCPREAWPW